MSVVVPLYNKAPYIEAALRSVQVQSFQDLEIIVVDDGSTDGGAAVVEGFDDPRIALIRQANAGAGAARNAGIAAGRGRWIAFLDADDLWLPDKIARQLQLLEAHPDVVWAAGCYIRGNSEGYARKGPRIAPKLFAAENVVRDALALMAGRAVWTSTVVVRREALAEVGGFDSALRVGQDLDLWVRLAVGHPRLAYVQKWVTIKRDIADSLTALSRAEGFSTASECARRWTEIAKALPPERSDLVRALARQTVDRVARREFIARRPGNAREVLAILPVLQLGAPSWRVRIATHVPGWVLSFLLDIRRKLRQWLSQDQRSIHSSVGRGAYR